MKNIQITVASLLIGSFSLALMGCPIYDDGGDEPRPIYPNPYPEPKPDAGRVDVYVPPKDSGPWDTADAKKDTADASKDTGPNDSSFSDVSDAKDSSTNPWVGTDWEGCYPGILPSDIVADQGTSKAKAFSTSKGVCLSNIPVGLVSLSVGYANTCALKADGSSFCWGANNAMQATSQKGPFIKFAVGENATCGLKAEGFLQCAGTASWISAAQDLVNVESFAIGKGHLCAVIKGTQNAVCVGDNSSGQGTAPSGRYKNVTAGLAHSCAIDSNDEVKCWGDNALGQTNAPSGKFASLSTGNNFNCAIASDGNLSCWGENSASQTTAPSGSWASVSAGANHACALRADGTMACWGDSTFGQSTTVSGTFKEIAVGRRHSCAMTSQTSQTSPNAIVCWGDNTNLQSAPVPIN